ncbi:MAG: class I SAM-dependent methyltransferase [Thermoplasmata archaeon]
MGQAQGFARFERIAEVYDETREPLDAETLAGLVRYLTDDACRDLLEIGVGTGRIGRPLADAGFQVTGIDPARNMIRRARAKGLDRLIRGRGETLPFRDDAFDSALFVHVIHVLSGPAVVLRRAGRVARRSVLALGSVII